MMNQLDLEQILVRAEPHTILDVAVLIAENQSDLSKRLLERVLYLETVSDQQRVHNEKLLSYIKVQIYEQNEYFKRHYEEQTEIYEGRLKKQNERYDRQTQFFENKLKTLNEQFECVQKEKNRKINKLVKGTKELAIKVQDISELPKCMHPQPKRNALLSREILQVQFQRDKEKFAKAFPNV